MEPISRRIIAWRLALAAALGTFLFWLFGRRTPQEATPLKTTGNTGMFRQARVLKERSEAGYETRDLNTCGVAVSGCLFAVGLVVAVLIATGVFSLLSGRPPQFVYPPAGLANAPGPTLPPPPQLEAVPGQQFQQFRTGEEQMLRSYGWIDKNRGIVRIPIDRAMQLIVAQGLPSRPASDAQQFQDKGNELPSLSSSGRMMERVYK